MDMKTFLYVGCGPKRKERTTRGFNTDAWSEIRLDIDPSVSPDVTGTMTDMASVSAGYVNALPGVAKEEIADSNVLWLH